MTVPLFSVVIPAHNEQDFLPACLRSITAAAGRIAEPVETIVVANRCTDETAAVAEVAGCRVVIDDSHTVAAVRNAGAAVATGMMLITIDADSTMHRDTFREAKRRLLTGRFVGGAVRVLPERSSPGIAVTMTMLNVALRFARTGGGLYWCWRRDFRAIGGFDERLQIGEDLDFAKRLRHHGRATDRSFVVLENIPIVTSCRKYDRFGDWFALGLALRPGEALASIRGSSRVFADRYLYDFNS